MPTCVHTTSQWILRIVYCNICPDLPHTAQCPHSPTSSGNKTPWFLFRQSLQPQPLVSLRWFSFPTHPFPVYMLPPSPCLYSTLVLSQHLKSFRLLLFVTLWGDCLNAGSLRAVEPTGWRRRFSPKWECRLPMTYSQRCSIKPSWKLYLTAASLRTTAETLRALWLEKLNYSKQPVRVSFTQYLAMT